MIRPTFSLLLLLLATVLSFAGAVRHSNEHLTPGKRAPAPQPSRRMGITRKASSKGPVKPLSQQRQQIGPISRKDFSAFLCPDGATACPVPAPGSKRSAASGADLQQIATWLAGGFECIPINEELDSCGGCLSLGQGQDCSAIPNTRDVSCDRGSCVVQRCKEAFVVGVDGKSCVRSSTINKFRK